MLNMNKLLHKKRIPYWNSHTAVAIFHLAIRNWNINIKYENDEVLYG